MKKHLRIALGIVIAAAGAAQEARAQENQGAIYYLISAPTAGSGDFLDDQISFRGIGFESVWNSPGSPLALGFSLRWIYFRNVEEDATFDTDGATVNGRLYRAIDSFPLQFLARYNFRQDGASRMYAGVGIGTIYGLRELDIGAFGQSETGWQLAVSPEIGIVLAKPSASAGFTLNLRYDAGFGSDAITAISNLTLGIGVASSI